MHELYFQYQVFKLDMTYECHRYIIARTPTAQSLGRAAFDDSGSENSGGCKNFGI